MFRQADEPTPRLANTIDSCRHWPLYARFLARFLTGDAWADAAPLVFTLH
jgi:hypothetical protein